MGKAGILELASQDAGLAVLNRSKSRPRHAGALGSQLGEAVNYAAHQEEFVRRYFSDGRFEIDHDGEIERVLKKPCLGRRNFLHTGSAKCDRRALMGT